MGNLRLFFSVVVLMAVMMVDGAVSLPHVLGDNMVLQRNSEVELWGNAVAKAEVTVTVSWDKGKKYATKSDASGRWSVKVKTPEAGGPYEIEIKDRDGIVRLRNVLSGEVWFCSGQSNMEMPMRGFYGQPVEGANEAIAKANKRVPIRVFSADYKADAERKHYDAELVTEPQQDYNSAWKENDSECVASTSAVAYYFAKELNEALDVPVGIIVSSLGGSKIEPWMSRECASRFSEIDLKDIKMPVISAPTVLYNAKVAPFLRYVIRGVIWYQGESNRMGWDRYADYFEQMVGDWRAKWGLGDIPFYAVEIAPYEYAERDPEWAARLREAQQQGIDRLKNAGIVCTADVGAARCIHPSKKREVGMRLALQALHETYGRGGFVYKSPRYKSMSVEGRKVLIKMENPGIQLLPKGEVLEGFEVAGEDRQFHKAQALISERNGSEIEVWSAEVAEPKAVRYCFAKNCAGSVWDIGGLPLHPFRTDNW